jgi:hypothetical protein
MITPSELLRILLAPLIVSALVAAIGRRQNWAWAMPFAAGAGFLAGYALIGVPKLPPRDGTDWLFWLAVPVTVLGTLDATRRLGDGRVPRHLPAPLAAGLVAWVIVLPLSATLSTPVHFGMAMAFAAATYAVQSALGHAGRRLGAATIVAALCVTVGASAVVLLSTNTRILGIYGIAAAVALGPVAALAGPMRCGRSVAIVAMSLLAGLLAGGHFYADPGITWLQAGALFVAPAMVAVGSRISVGRHVWARGAVSLLLVAAVVSAITVPAALSAKRAAEQTSDDPYASYHQ